MQNLYSYGACLVSSSCVHVSIGPVFEPLSGVNFGWHLQTAIITSAKMMIASRAVAMAVMTQARIIDVEQASLRISPEVVRWDSGSEVEGVPGAGGKVESNRSEVKGDSGSAEVVVLDVGSVAIEVVIGSVVSAVVMSGVVSASAMAKRYSGSHLFGLGYFNPFISKKA